MAEEYLNLKKFKESVKDVMKELRQKIKKEQGMNTLSDKDQGKINVLEEAILMEMLRLEETLDFDFMSLSARKELSIKLMLDRYEFNKENHIALGLSLKDEMKAVKKGKNHLETVTQESMERLSNDFGKEVFSLINSALRSGYEKVYKGGAGQPSGQTMH